MPVIGHEPHHRRQPSAIPQRILLGQKLAEENTLQRAPVGGNTAIAAMAVCFSPLRTAANYQNNAERSGSEYHHPIALNKPIGSISGWLYPAP